MPIILLDNELWDYIYPKEFISNKIQIRLDNIVDNYNYESNKSLDFVDDFLLEKIVDNNIKNEILNNHSNM